MTIGKPIVLIKDVPTHRMFRTGQAAKYLGVSINTLNKFVKTGRIKPVDLDGERRYPIEELERFCDSLKTWRGKHKREAEGPSPSAA